MFIIDFLLNVRGYFIFWADEEGLIEQSAEVKIGSEMCKAITVNFFILFKATFDKKQ